MKRNKIIGLCVALGGMLVAFGSSIALYTKGVGNVQMTIGAATHTTSTETVQYKINGLASPTVAPTYMDGTANPTIGGQSTSGVTGNTNHQVKYEFLLGADFGDNVTAQDYVTGNLSVTLNNIDSSIQGKLKANIYVTGYTEGKLGHHFYEGSLKSGENDINNNLVFDSSSLTITSKDICVSSAGNVHKLVVEFTLNDNIDILTMNEKAALWNLSVTWGAPSNDFHAAYIVSNHTLWAEDDEFVMAPNILANYAQGQFAWWGQVKGSQTLSLAKCHIGSTWSGGSDAQLENGTTYNVSWDGTGNAASFSVR